MKQQFRLLLFGVLALACVGLLQFVCCTGIAMLRFPDGYSFTDNYLSELGFMGHPGHTLFNGSLVFLGVSLIPLYGLLWATDMQGSFSLRASAVLGLVSALGIIGYGSWTYDRQFILHHIALAMWMFPMLYMVVAFYFGAAQSPVVGIGFLATSLVMVVTMIAVLMSTQTTSAQLLQKMVVICGVVWLGFMVAFVYRAGQTILQTWIEDDGSRQKKEQQYLSTLTSGQHRRD